MDCDYFPLLYRREGKERFLLWHSGEEIDSVVLNSAGYILSFSCLAELCRFADANALQVDNAEPELHDLDYIAFWVREKNTCLDCEQTLNAWNFFCDIANSVDCPQKRLFSEYDAQLNAVYDKLFWRNNLPALTPPGERFVPVWSAEEINALVLLLSAGLELFASCTQNA